MKLRKILALILALMAIAAMTLLIASCDDEEETEDGAGENGTALETLVLSADSTDVERNTEVKLTVSFKPENAETVYNGSTYESIDVSKIRYYVEEGGTNRLLEGSGATATFTATKGGTYVIYAEYVTSRYNSYPQIISNKITVKVHGVRISDVEDLKLMNGSSDGFELNKDIDLGGAKWSPIEFSGNFDGQGHKISNFTLSDNVSNLGFFSVLKGTVRNVVFENVTVDVTSNKSHIGIIAGENRGTIIGCTVSGSISTVAANRVGGIAGYNDATISGCINKASVSGAENVGGIVGYAYGTVNSCTNEGAISGNGYVGGIAGYMNGTVSESVNKGEVNGNGSRVGGIVGHAISKISNCDNQAEVTSREDYVGGVVGYNEAEGFGCKNSGNVTGRYYVGGAYGYSTKALSSFTNSASISARAYLGGVVGKSTSTLDSCVNNGDIISTGYIIEENAERSYVGGLAGYCTGITNGKNVVDITASGIRVGGLAGYCSGNVSSSVNEGAVSGKNSVGGIAGRVDGSCTYTSCTNIGTVSGSTYVGGIAGYINGTAKLDSCVNNATITGSDGNVGGLAGWVNGIEVVACQNTADITGGYYVGGFVGCAYSTSTIRGAVNNNIITAEYRVGGILGGGASTALIDCENYGAVLATGAFISNNYTYSYVGGLAGNCGSITNGKNVVSISGIASYVGGLAGNVSGNISNSENSGDVVGGDEYTGGLAGYVLSNITGSVNNGSVTGVYQTGGLAGNVRDGRIDNSANYGKVIGKHNVGGIVGHVESKIEIIYTKNEADVTGENMVGGFVGFIGSTSSIRNATNANVITGSSYVGGILGSGSNTALYDCENYGTVIASSVTTVNNLPCSYVGGLAGHCGTISNGKNTADITGIGAYVGGLAGYSGAVTNSQNDGGVSGADYTGGLCGYMNGNAIESKNYGSVEGLTYVGGIAGYINGQKVEKCENHGGVKGSSTVGGICGYEYYKNCEISFCKNYGNVVGESTCGSLVGQVYNGATVRYSENAGKINGGNEPFIKACGGTVKGVIVVDVPTDLKVSVNDTVTWELLGITAKEYDTKNALQITLTLESGDFVGGNVVTYMAVVSDSYGNTDTRYIDVSVYGMPEISYTTNTLSATTNPLYKGSLVTFDLNGVSGTAPAPQLIADGVTLKYPSIPVVDGYAFRGWYTEIECVNLYDFTADLKGDITLFAGWEEMVKFEYKSRTYVDITKGYNTEENAYSFSTSGAYSSSPMYIYFTVFESGTHNILYKAGTNGAYWYIRNETKNEDILPTVQTANGSFRAVEFTADAGDVICLRLYGNYGTTCNFYVYGTVTINDGGKDVLYKGTAEEILGIDARDSFGEALEVTVSLKSGELTPGQTVIYTITATDSVGNTYSVDTLPITVTE